jgi:hypothetical protein
MASSTPRISELDQQPKQVKSEQQNQRARDWRECSAMLPQERANRAGGGAKRNKYHRKTQHECQRRRKKPAARLLPLA